LLGHASLRLSKRGEGLSTHNDLRHSSTLRDYLNVVRRRKWIILQALILVPAVAFYLSDRQQKTYQADAQVLLSQQNLANALTGVSDSTVFQSVDRISQTQANLARVPKVAADAIAISGIESRPPGQLLAESSVTADPASNLLYFSVTDTSPSIATKLTTAYARAFVRYRHELDTTSLRQARGELEGRMFVLRKSGQGSSRLYGNLLVKDELLRTMEALQTSNASVIRDASGASKVGPRPFRDGMLGLALGIVLGFGLAFLREALDTRVRSADEISERLGLPLLARLPEPPRRLRRSNKLAMLADPHDSSAEAFRILRTNLDFVRLNKKASVILVTSALEAEGKSTTAANLAIALARSGKRVALVDLDLRRPFLDRFFPPPNQLGLTHVALGYATLEQALIKVPVIQALPHPKRPRTAAGNGNGATRVEGLLEVLTSGPLPPNLDEFISTPEVADILGRLRERADVVLVDATPLLLVGDAMSLTAVVDAMMIVTRINVVRRPILKELRRVLDNLPAEKLGFVVTGAEHEETYGGYGAYTYHSYSDSTRVADPVS